MNVWLVNNREKIIAFVAASIWVRPLVAIAGVVKDPTGVPPGFKDFSMTVTTIFNIVITVAGVAFVVLFLLGGIQYLSAAGNDEGTKKARQLMLDAVIGLAIVVVAWAVGTYVLELLGLGKQGEIDLAPKRL